MLADHGLSERTRRTARPAGLDRRRLGQAVFGSETDIGSVTGPPSWINTVVGLLFGADPAGVAPRPDAFAASGGADVGRGRTPGPRDWSPSHRRTRWPTSPPGATSRWSLPQNGSLGHHLSRRISACAWPAVIRSGRPDHWPGSDHGLAGRCSTRYGWTPAVIGASEAGRHRVRPSRAAGHPAGRRGDLRDPGVPSRRPGDAAGTPGRAAAGEDGLPHPGPPARRHPGRPSWCN